MRGLAGSKPVFGDEVAGRAEPSMDALLTIHTGYVGGDESTTGRPERGYVRRLSHDP